MAAFTQSRSFALAQAVESIIRVDRLDYTYTAEGAPPVQALRDINLTIYQGEYVVILGANGSGKSTLARQLNGLLLPSQGDVWVKEWNTKDPQHRLAIRATVGMVFQSPDNQIVATIVEEDVAFGPENLNVERQEILHRVAHALGAVEMWEQRQRSPHMLSGGQKQRVAIASVLAMQPAVLVLDEATAMLDPDGRKAVLAIAQRLNREEGVTVVAITHFMQEAVHADRIIVMADGAVALQGTPREIFAQAERLRALALDVPPINEVALALRQHLPDFPLGLLTIDEMVAEVTRRRAASGKPVVDGPLPTRPASAPGHGQPPTALITVEQLGHNYMRGTPLATKALDAINLTINQGEIVGIIGHTGSGKSTVIQHFNGLLRPHTGKVTIFGQALHDGAVDLLTLRRRVGLVFQFPEAQLFERYVGDDIAFGPRNLKLSREAIRERVRRAMTAVGLDFTKFKDRLTFRLSGGQLRRVALAGVLALEPEVLVLDEPTAGLDPQGRRQLLAHLRALHAGGMTLVIVSHNMEELAALCDRLYVLSAGRTVMSGTPAQVFSQAEQLQALNLDVPEVTQLTNRLRAAGVIQSGATVYTVDDLVDQLRAVLY